MDDAQPLPKRSAPVRQPGRPSKSMMPHTMCNNGALSRDQRGVAVARSPAVAVVVCVSLAVLVLRVLGYVGFLKAATPCESQAPQGVAATRDR